MDDQTINIIDKIGHTDRHNVLKFEITYLLELPKF